eukprot:8532_1
MSKSDAATPAVINEDETSFYNRLSAESVVASNPTITSPHRSSFREILSCNMSMVKFYFHHTFSEIKARKFNFCLGFTSCFMVVLCCHLSNDDCKFSGNYAAVS